MELSLEKRPEELVYSEEQEHLQAVRQQLIQTIKTLEDRIDSYGSEYRTSKRYLAEYRNEIDSMEIFSNEQSIERIEKAGNFTQDQCIKNRKLLDSPYFARIDFQYENEPDSEPVYIGRYSFANEQGEILIHDWRAPISGLFYDFEPGPAFFRAPLGEVSGELLRKRQLRIKNGMLEFVVESRLGIHDEILQKELSRSSDDKMKNIISTIQKEQNRIIRDEQSEILIIQGSAGSGKTSVALHRAAYLLYRQRERISAQNILILSPNRVFGDYISSVLPELGEEPILTTSFDDLLLDEMPERLTVENPYSRWNDLSSLYEDHDKSQRLIYKSSYAFLSDAEEFLKSADHLFFHPKPHTFGVFLLEADFVKTQYDLHSKRPVLVRLQLIADAIMEQFKSQNLLGKKLPARSEILKALRAMHRIKDTLDLCRQFYRWLKKPEFFHFDDCLEWCDTAPYLYFKSYWEGLGGKKAGGTALAKAERTKGGDSNGLEAVRHLIIDEMQDYTPVQYSVLSKLFSCKMTILGDFHQKTQHHNQLTLPMLSSFFGINAQVAKLHKSYRSTWEIIRLAEQIKTDTQIEAISRHGDLPELICYSKSEYKETETIEKVLSAFQESQDRTTLGILCKSFDEAEFLYGILSDKFTVHLLTADSRQFRAGITLATVFMSKGLEFDEVILPFVTKENYRSEHERDLLYIAVTRAMHKLTLTCSGEPSPLLPDNESILDKSSGSLLYRL